MFGDDEEISFCFVGATALDDQATDDVEELHENVWFRMKPPKKSASMYAPFVTARQIDLVRALLAGKSTLKSDDIRNVEDDINKAKKKKPPRRDISPNEVKISLKMRQSSIKYFDQVTREHNL